MEFQVLFGGVHEWIEGWEFFQTGTIPKKESLKAKVLMIIYVGLLGINHGRSK